MELSSRATMTALFGQDTWFSHAKTRPMGAGGDMIPWKGAKLTTVKEKELPRTQKATAFFPFRAEDSNDRILGFLRKQNAVLKVEC